MGTNIQRYHLTADDFGGEQYNGCNDFWSSRADVIEEIHASFLSVGSEVVETCTFRSNPLTLRSMACRIAPRKSTGWRRSSAARGDRFEAETGIPRMVAGSMGPSGKLPSGNDPDLSNITFDELARVFYTPGERLGRRRRRSAAAGSRPGHPRYSGYRLGHQPVFQA
ncbi:MAG: homocysteine S-methyltransferase family protein [Anaerolineae bacterium]